MSLDVARSFRNGLRELYGPRGVVVGLSLLFVAIGNLYVQQSIQLHLQRWLFGFLAEGEMQEEMLAQAGTNLPFALEVGLAVLLIGTLVLLLVDEIVRLVGIRLFGSESDEPIPFDDVTENFGSAALKMLVIGGAFSIVVSLVNFVPLLGQVVGWILVLVFVYLRQVIALEDLGFVETVSRSFDLFMEEPLPIAAILLVLGLLGLVVSAGVPVALEFFVFADDGATATGSLLGNSQALAQLLGVTLGVLFQVLGVATVTDAYKQVRASADESAA